MIRFFIVILLLGTTHSWAQENLETVVQRGHALAVRSVCFSPDGKLLASGSEDKTVKIWEFSTGRELKTLNGHQSNVNQVLFTSDGAQVVSASRDRYVFFWDLKTGEIVKQFYYPDENIVSIALSPSDKLLAIGSTARVVRVIDLKTDSVTYKWKANPTQKGAYVEFNSDGSKLVVGEDDRIAKVYSLSDGALLHTIREPSGMCGNCDTKATFLNDERIIKGSRRSPLAIRSINDDQPRAFMEDSPESLHALKLSPDKSKMISVDEDSAVVWDIKSRKRLFTLDNGLSPINPKYGLNLLGKMTSRRSDQFNDVSFSPDGKWLATAANNNLITIWDAQTGEKRSVFYGYLSVPSDDGLNFDPNSFWNSRVWGLVALKNKIQLSPDGKYAFRAKAGYEARKWELATGKVVQTYFGHTKGVIALQLSADGKYLLTGGADRLAKLWDVETGNEIRTFKGHRSFIYQVGFSHDQTKILTSSDDGTVKIWDRESGDLLQTITMSGDPSVIAIGYTVKFTLNDLYILVAYTHGTFKLLEIDTGREVKEFIGHTHTTADFEVLPNGRQMISCGWDHTLRLWDMTSGMQVRKFIGHTDNVHTVAINGAGTRVASGGNDRDIFLWDISSGNVIKKFIGHKSIVTDVHFTADGRYLISSTIDGIVKVWDIETGQEVITHYSIDSKDWLVTTPQGYFNGTGDAQKQVFFVKGLESYSLDRFFDKFYSPEETKKAFELGVISDQKQGLLHQLNQFPAPEAEINTPKEGDVVKKATIEILSKIKNTGGGVKAVSILHNGKVIEKREEAYFTKLPEGKSMFQKFNIKLVPGLNAISVMASNEKNIESRSSQVMVSYESDEGESVCYVLAIGINEYQNPALNLNYAQDDAAAFAEAAKSSGKDLYDRVEVHQIFNKDASRTNILGALDILSKKIKTNDVFYLYYAGHGSMVDNEFYFVPTENTRLYSADKLKKDAISATYLQQKLTNIQALKQLVLIDACQSGGSVELLAQRGAREEKAMAQLSRSAGIHVLSAAGSEQFATEYAEIGHGVFTYALLEALKGKADGAPKDGTVSIYELKSYLETIVPEYSQKFKGQVQYPYTFSKGQDFPVSILKK
ncbi:MAG: caspase family protein [Bacteroidota bacterium]